VAATLLAQDGQGGAGPVRLALDEVGEPAGWEVLASLWAEVLHQFNALPWALQDAEENVRPFSSFVVPWVGW
jgi:hypothetical protein